MLGWLDSNGLRIAGYAAAAIAAFVAGRRERPLVGANPNLWPAFWFLTSGLFLFMALGRAADFAGLATDLGRSEAVAHGWYAERRKFQAALVGSLGAIWFVAVVVALWRVPERRRRYLPMAIVAFSLMCYAGIRVVSLHQVDAVLYRRHLAGAKVGSVVEFLGLATAIAVTSGQAWFVARPGPTASSRLVGSERSRGSR
ncbi:MAG: hypothetical protein QOD72_511 [Acidimicrobiaceae bacterium]|jgi:hypothetical protein|nr:hypothetical protein [Acidimicrobiaceae bacterium]